MEVETVDKGGNFIGWLFIDGKNLSLSLVEVCVPVLCVCASAVCVPVLCSEFV